MIGDAKMGCEAQEERQCSDFRKVNLTDVIELFRDPEAETVSEGYAKVWAILDEDEEYYTLVVSFMDDPKAPGRKFTRKYRKRKP